MGATMEDTNQKDSSAQQLSSPPVPDALKNVPLLYNWVSQVAELCQPGDIEVIDGTDSCYQRLLQVLVQKGTFIPLNSNLRPRSFLARSHPRDVARVEERTFICSRTKVEAGPTNNWKDPLYMREKLHQLFKGAMVGRVLYVVPFCLGPLGSAYARYGVELTDSPYVAASLYLMARVGERALKYLETEPFVKCLHSVGVPLEPGHKDLHWPCRPDSQYIVHFPEDREVISFGSGYGGNALLNKKSFALRIASVLGRDEGWLAEHMLIVGITNPQGVKKYIAAAFPSQCGKTNFAMMSPQLPGWKVECVGDDIAWLFWDDNGELRAINPESGFFGVAPGTSMKTNPVAMETIKHDTIFANVGLTLEGDVFWEGIDTPPEEGVSWLGSPWKRGSGELAAHPNARFTVKIDQCPIVDPAWNNTQGVVISAILFGGRRASLIPLVREARSWEEGVFFGAIMSSEKTAAAEGRVGALRHDPFAMLPFCGYNMGDYFAHWLAFGAGGKKKLPGIFAVNWFLAKQNAGQEKRYLWPGFGDNIRVVDWIFKRLLNEVEGEETCIGIIPKESEFLLQNQRYLDLFPMDSEGWKNEIAQIKNYFAQFGEKLPKKLAEQVQKLEEAYGTGSTSQN